MADPNERCEPDFAAFIGIDWADQRHAWALQSTARGAIEHGDVDHTPEAVDAWIVPKVGAVTSSPAELDIVDVWGASTFENTHQLVLRAIQ